METRIFRSVNKSMGVTVEGEYKKASWGNAWLLVRWRIGSRWKGSDTAGDWHKIHGNQRKDIGALKLVLDNWPDREMPADPFGFWSTPSL